MSRSIDGLVMVLLGGIQTLVGPIVGASVFTWLEDTVARQTDYWQALLGADDSAAARDGVSARHHRVRARPIHGGRMSLLRIEQLTKAFDGVKVVDGVSFALDAGQLLALIGPNGAGKSTCFNTINGQLAATFNSMTVLENVQMALLSRERRMFDFFGRVASWREDEAMALLDLVGMAAHADAVARCSHMATSNASNWRLRWPTIRSCC